MKKHVTPLFDQAALAKGTAADTRREARAAVEANIDHLRGAVLRALLARGEHGATDEELACELQLRGDTERARRCELRDAGLVLDSGRRRPVSSGRRATVWVASTAQPPSAPTPRACVHTLDHRTGSWVERTRNGERIIECGKCGKYFGHVISQEIARPRARPSPRG